MDEATKKRLVGDAGAFLHVVGLLDELLDTYEIHRMELTSDPKTWRAAHYCRNLDDGKQETVPMGLVKLREARYVFDGQQVRVRFGCCDSCGQSVLCLEPDHFGRIVKTIHNYKEKIRP
jgi:hypothetical protein